MSKDNKVVRTYTYHRNGVALHTDNFFVAVRRNDGVHPVIRNVKVIND